MAKSSEETKTKLLECAKKEFLEKGFMNASLRTIAANAGVTTGAMYRHFKDKDAFFCALVDETIEITTKYVMMADSSYHAKLDNPVSKEHFQEEQKEVLEILDYMYEHFDIYELLLLKSAGSTHENFKEEMCELYTKNCKETFDWMYDQKIATKKIDYISVHFIASIFIEAFAEIVLHKMKKQEALAYIENMTEFTRYGSIHVLGIPCSTE